MRGPTLADDYHALEARYDELLVERDRLAEDNDTVRGDLSEALTRLRAVVRYAEMMRADGIPLNADSVRRLALGRALTPGVPHAPLPGLDEDFPEELQP